MYETEFSQRLAGLRAKRGVSARDMSISLGQNPGYINAIETGKAFPTMTNFFYICEFLNISPGEFFDTETEDPERIRTLTKQLKSLNDQQLNAVSVLLDALVAQL